MKKLEKHRGGGVYSLTEKVEADMASYPVEPKEFMTAVSSTGAVIGAAIRKNQWLNTQLRGALSSGFKTLCWLQWKLTKKLYLHHVEIAITLRCSLKCKKCSSLIPYIEKPVTYDTERIIAQMDKLFTCVDSIYWFRILGGEPLLHPELGRIVDKALSCSKLRTVDVVTNGTIVPSDELLSHMKNPRFTLAISDYGPHSPKINEIKQKCDAAGVQYKVWDWDENMLWSDMGGLEKRGRSSRELKQQLHHCSYYCRSLLDGKLYYCPRASSGQLLGIPVSEGECVNLMSGKSVDELRKEIFELDQKKVVSICDRCDKGTERCKTIPAAEQL